MSVEAVYCECGAQWHGRYVASPVIRSHENRHGCALISHEKFLRFGKKCGCEECRAARKRPRRADKVERLIHAAKDWAGWQDDDSIRDQKNDADLKAGAERATSNLLAAIEEL